MCCFKTLNEISMTKSRKFFYEKTRIQSECFSFLVNKKHF